jgi:hypothetical protein
LAVQVICLVLRNNDFVTDWEDGVLLTTGCAMFAILDFENAEGAIGTDSEEVLLIEGNSHALDWKGVSLDFSALRDKWLDLVGTDWTWHVRLTDASK